MTKNKKNICPKSEIFSTKGLLKIIDGLPLAVAVIDKRRRVVLANKAIALWANKKNSQLIGQVGGNAFGCINSDNPSGGCGHGEACRNCKLRVLIEDSLKKGLPHFMIETVMTFKLQGKKFFWVTIQPMELNGAPVVLLSLKDVTKIKKYDQEKQEKEKLAVVFQTVGAICHEMNQPLMAILGFSELLASEMTDGDITESNVLEIKEQAEKLGQITRKLMSITRYRTKEYLNARILDVDAATSNEQQEKKDL